MEALFVVLVATLVAVPGLLVVALVMIAGLRRRVLALESALLATPVRDEAAADAHRNADSASTPASPPQTPAAAETLPPPLPLSSAAVRPEPLHVPSTPAPSKPGVTAAAGLVERLSGAVRHWFTEGNVPVRIGMLVLLAGVAALLKYVSDQGLLDVPIELRLAAITLGALLLLVMGWRQRERRRMFALSLQGGAIGVLLLTIFAAFRLYGLVDALPTFVASVALVAGLGMLAVVQDSRTLAVLGILAGFMAPLWLSTGNGNHVALFGYYAVLNAGIFAIAWYRSWRVLNLLGFAFTFVIGAVWGVLQYGPEDLPTTQPFLQLFFAFYLLIPLLHARRQPTAAGNVVDGSLVFGTPLVAFSLQAAMLHDQPMVLAGMAVALAALYALLAGVLMVRARHLLLAQSYAVLAVGFATLAVPLALSARATGAVFALEGAGLVWLGLHQQRRLPQISGALLQVAAAFAFVAGADYWFRDSRLLLNPTAMGALLLAVSGFASAWNCRRHGRHDVALVYYLWALAWWLGGLAHDLMRFLPSRVEPDALLIVAAVSAWLAAEAHRQLPARALSLTTLIMMATAFPLLLWQLHVHRQPLQGQGALAWLAMLLLGMRALHALRRDGGLVANIAQFLWWLAWPLVLSLALLWVARHGGLAQGWSVLLVLLPWWLLTALSVWRWPWVRQPLGAAFDAMRPALQGVLFIMLGLAWLRVHALPGWATPLPWLPVANPAELMQWAILLLAARWLYSRQAPVTLHRLRVPLLAFAGFIALTSLTLHAVHHGGRVAWNDALWHYTLAQSSLTVVWSVLGVIAWVWGSRRGQRVLWITGAVLMAVVLAKLILIDRQHLGNLLGIASFIAYGLLCTVVGYFAPAPPRQVTQNVENAG